MKDGQPVITHHQEFDAVLEEMHDGGNGLPWSVPGLSGCRRVGAGFAIACRELGP
ncbi:hypothetical protein GCM10009596_15550 [Arthrobacter rhombi]